MIKAKHDGQYKQVGFIKVRQPDGTYKDVEKKYGKTTGGEYGLVFEKGFTRELEGELPLTLNGIGKSLKDYDIESNTYQSDGVSPDTPQEVKGVGERTGNLWKTFSSKVSSGVTITHDGEKYLFSGTCNESINISLGAELDAGTYSLQANANRIPVENINSCIDVWIPSLSKLYNIKNEVATYNTISFSIDTPVACYLRIRLENGVNYDGFELKPMLNAGSTPLPYEPYGYKVDVVTRGKNLVDIANLTGKTSTLFADNVNPKLAQVKFDEATQYTISMKFDIDYTNGWRKITFTYTDGTTSVSPWIAVSGVFEYTSTSGKTVAKVEFTNLNYYGDIFVEYIQLEAGTEATSYEPYTPPITTPIYLDSPLYKIGNYADVRGKTEEVRVIKELVLTGEENWGKSQSTNTFYIQNTPNVSANQALTICDHFIYTGETKGGYGTYYTPPTTVHQFNFVWDDSATIDEWKSYLAAQYAAGTPVKVYYILAEPETKAVDAVEIPTLNWTTVIDVDTEVKPSNVYIKYKSSK